MSNSTEITFGSREDRGAVETGLVFAPKFDEHGLIVAVAQDEDTNEVLMVAYMNEESLRQTLALGEAVYIPAAGSSSGTRARPRATPGRQQDPHRLRPGRPRPQGAPARPGLLPRRIPILLLPNIQEPGAPVALGQEIADQSYDPNQVYK